ncbi:unnamed protein product [Penicillium pancosmium]
MLGPSCMEVLDCGAEGPPGPESPPGPRGERAEASVTTGWKTDDVGYFTPNPLLKEHVRTEKGLTHYNNVYAFLNQLMAMAQLKSEEVVRAHIPLCLRDAASRW